MALGGCPGAPLYDPCMEHDGCGVGFVARCDRVEAVLEVLVEHIDTFVDLVTEAVCARSTKMFL